MFSANRKKLGDLLVEVNMISPEDLEKVMTIQKQTGKKVGEILIEQKMATEADIIQVLEFQLGIPHVSLEKYEIEDSVVSLVSEAIAKRYVLIPIKHEDNLLTVAMSDPLNVFAIDDIRISTGMDVKPVIATKTDVLKAIDKHYSVTSANKAAQEISKQVDELYKVNDSDDDEKMALEVNSSPAVKLVNSLLEQAIKGRASDIHIEPFEQFIRMRFRIDGELQETMRSEVKTLSALVTRIKIMGGMNIAEKRIPQDGRISYSFQNKEYDLRVSVLPTVFGEKVVMRIAETRASVVSKTQLGFQEEDLKKFDALLKNPHGIILVTGPTGSGKSTTLYTALKELNQPNVNIVTVEDPVENVVEGVNQVNVNTKAGLTFANALRSILRQDPDIVMIGEIRDGETAEIAVKAAITGHLVLSTVHTNDAPSTVNRLVDMGIEPFLLSSSLVGVIAQRLVRRICKSCKKEYIPSEAELRTLGVSDPNFRLYKGTGCKECNNTGYRGRIGIHEILVINKEIREAISRKLPTETLKDICINNGMKILKESGFQLVLKGITTLDEIFGVAYDNEDSTVHVPEEIK